MARPRHNSGLKVIFVLYIERLAVVMPDSELADNQRNMPANAFNCDYRIEHCYFIPAVSHLVRPRKGLSTIFTELWNWRVPDPHPPIHVVFAFDVCATLRALIDSFRAAVVAERAGELRVIVVIGSDLMTVHTNLLCVVIPHAA
jgi:hypothetical protein